MKDQYVGDINDYRKYAILRALAGAGATKIGICWMMTPPDGRPDGRMIEYLGKPAEWRSYDPPLFYLLQSIVSAPDQRRLALIEGNQGIPGASYANAVVPAGLAARDAYFDQVMTAMSDRDIIFFDPDNGLDVPSVAKSQRNAPKYVFRDEIAAAYEAGHSVLFYQHFARVERNAFIDRISVDLLSIAPDATPWVFRTSHVAFFLLAQPRHAQDLRARITAAEHRWTSDFVIVGHPEDAGIEAGGVTETAIHGSPGWASIAAG